MTHKHLTALTLVAEGDYPNISDSLTAMWCDNPTTVLCFPAAREGSTRGRVGGWSGSTVERRDSVVIRRGACRAFVREKWLGSKVKQEHFPPHFCITPSPPQLG